MATSETTPTISVALCTFNGMRYLQEQLDSIAAQTRLPLEVVIVDDCSTDQTLPLVKAFAQQSRFPVHIVQNPSQLGSTRTFDKAIRLCRGDYIALSDQDDRWRTGKLSALAELLDQYRDTGMVFSDATLIDANSQRIDGTLWQSFRFPRVTRERFTEAPGEVLLARPVVTGATMIFRRTLLEHFSSIPPDWVHDGWITWMSVLWSKARFLEEPVTEYRIHTAQQLGVGEQSLVGRLNEIRLKQRTIYTKMSQQFASLLSYVEQSPKLARQDYWLEEIRQAAHLFAMRSKAPVGLGSRLLFLYRHLAVYRSLHAPTWRVLARDLLMR